MTDQQAPVNAPPPGGPRRQMAGEHLAERSIVLSIVAPFAGILSIFVATFGMYCPNSPANMPGAPNFFFLALAKMSILLYYSAVLGSGTAVICGGLALRAARRGPLARAYRGAAVAGIVVGLLGGAFVIYPGYPIFSVLYAIGSRGDCLTI